MRRYSRVVVKLSGQALAGPAGWGADPASLARLADELPSVHELGVELAVVIGGGELLPWPDGRQLVERS